MLRKNRVLVAVVAVAVMMTMAAADWNRTALLINAPTADVLPPMGIAFTANGTVPLGLNDVQPTGLNDPAQANLSIRFGVTKRLELALSAYTPVDYVIGASYQIVDGGKKKPSVAVGVHDLGYNAYVSPIGHGTATGSQFRDEMYPNRAAEVASIFAVTSIPIGSLGRIHVGLGRGRYVGFDNSKYINTDIIFRNIIPTNSSQYAIGLFAGGELNLGSHVRLALEADGRNLNAAVLTRFGPILINAGIIKLESPLWGGTKANSDFERFSAAVSYQSEQLLKPRRRVTPRGVPVPVFGSLSVSVLDQNTRTPISDAKITVVKAGAPEPITEPGVTTNSSGVFAVAGIPAGTYLVTAEKENYASKTQQVSAAAGEKAYLEILLEPSIAPVPLPPQPVAGTTTHLVPIYFGWDSANISAYSAEVLKDHASLINSQPNVSVTIVGSCDESGTHEYNMALGMRRAMAAYDYLKSLGVSANRMAYKSIGDIKSLPGEPIKHWKNRRCEFTTESK